MATKKKCPQLVEQLVQLNSEGKTNREIAKTLGLHHNTVKVWLLAEGLSSSWASQPIDKVSETEARCSKCKAIKDLEEFQHGRRGQNYEYRFSYCNSCRRKQSYLNLNSHLDKALRVKYKTLANRVAKTDIQFDLTWEEFLKLWIYQKGRCFYDESIIMKWTVGGGREEASLSVDRIDPDKGYTFDNVVLCSTRINTIKSNVSMEEMKRWMPGWYQKIKVWEGRRDEIKRVQVGPITRL